MKRIIVFLICLILVNIVFAEPSPELQDEWCNKTYGIPIEYGCKCPIGTSFYGYSCWTKTPEKACRELGGMVFYGEVFPGPATSNFECIKDGENIDEQVFEIAKENDIERMFMPWRVVFVLLLAGFAYLFYRKFWSKK